MRKYLFVLLAAAGAMVAMPVSAAPGDMDLATFLEKADKLEKKGALALLSGDFGKLKKEVEGASKSYRDRIIGDKEKGRAPHSCPPQRAGMSSDDLLKEFRTYPAAQRPKTSVRAAFFTMMKKRYPCA